MHASKLNLYETGKLSAYKEKMKAEIKSTLSRINDGKRDFYVQLECNN